MNNLEKLINDLSNYWDLSHEKVVDRLNHMNESEIKNVVNKMTKKFKNGGMIDCLRKGGSIKDCGCGSKVVKDQEPAGPLRARGTRPSSAGIFAPDIEVRDGLWFKNNGAEVRNQFTGNDLTQYFITPGVYGTPRLQKRIITNYDDPANADTTIVDGNGVRDGHSQKYIDAVTRMLQGSEPYATSGKDVRAVNKANKTGVASKQMGGNLPKKKQDLLKTKKK